MNTFTKLKLHLEQHMYKRGAHKGDAPADRYKRGKSHLRVVARPGTEATNAMVVRMYNTDILTAYEDGSIMVNTGGWWTSTTIGNLNDALRYFVPYSLSVSKRRVFGMSQQTMTCRGTTWAFYDGIKFDNDGKMRSTPLPFERKQADKEERAEFRKDIAESGFKGAFPILYQAAPLPSRSWLAKPMHKLVQDDVHANEWPELVSLVKYPRFRNQLHSQPAHEDWRGAWKALMATCTADMTEVVRTDVLYLP
jgi:hypothetical protein